MTFLPRVDVFTRITGVPLVLNEPERDVRDVVRLVVRFTDVDFVLAGMPNALNCPVLFGLFAIFVQNLFIQVFALFCET